MSAAAWSWVAAVASIGGLWIGGYNPRTGWLYGIACQAIWISYGIATDQPGMIALSIAFIAIYGRNLRRWRGTRFQPARQTTSEECPT